MEEEYEIQHYGFSIEELKKETTDMIHEEVDKACELLVQSITTSPQVDTDVATEIDRKKNILSNDIKELLKESLEEMGNIMTEHFSIPPNVTLSTDHIKLKSIDASEKELQEQHDELLNRFMMIKAASDKISNATANSALNGECSSLYKVYELQAPRMKDNWLSMNTPKSLTWCLIKESEYTTPMKMNTERMKLIYRMVCFTQLEQFYSVLRDELETYKNMESLIEMQDNAVEVAAASITAQADLNYIKELAANVKTKFN